MSLIKKKVLIDKDKYKYFVEHFETEQDAINYLELHLDAIARKFYRRKENLIEIELNLLSALEPKLDRVLAQKNTKLESIIGNLILRVVKK